MVTIDLLNQIGDLPRGDSLSVERDNGCLQFIGPSGIIRDQLLFKETGAVTRNPFLCVFCGD